MNISDVLIRVLKKDDQTSEQIRIRIEEEEKHDLEILAREARDREIAKKSQEEWEETRKHTLEIMAREAQDREMAKKLQEEEWEKQALEITAREARDREMAQKFQEFEQLKQYEINGQTKDEKWHCDDSGLKKIEKETKDRKSELNRLRAAARELEEEKRLKKAEEEEIAQLKRAPAAKEDNRRCNNIQARSSIKKSSRREADVVEEEDEDSEEASSKEVEERPVRRSSKPEVRRDALWSPKSAVAGMPRRKPSTASLCVQETEDEYTDTDASEDSEDDSAPRAPPPKIKSKPQASSFTLPLNVDDWTRMAQLQGFPSMGLGSPYRSASGSNSRSDSSSESPIYTPGVHSNPYFPMYGGSFSPPMGPYGYGAGMPGSVVNSGVGNIVNSTISNVGNDNSVKKVYRK
jgi:hypothetical protein